MTAIRRARRTAGFSLLELMLTLTVLGILVSIAVPSFSYLAANTKMKGASTDLHLALLKARSEAVKRTTTVTITPATAGNWAAGWRMTAGSTELIVQSPLAGVTITPRSDSPSSTQLASLVYLSSGRPQNLPANLRFELLPVTRNRTEASGTEIKRCIRLQANGSPYVQDPGATMQLTLAGHRGFTLLEVLITLIVLAIGLLGLANLQSKMQIAQVESYQRAQAVLLVQDMVNRINANRANSGTYVGTNVGASNDGYDYRVACNQATMSGVDICEWSKALKGASECTTFDDQGNCTGATRGGLIGGRGCITQLQAPNWVNCIPGSIQVSVAWQGLNPTVVPGNGCAAGAYGTDDRLRRVISQRAVISIPAC